MKQSWITISRCWSRILMDTTWIRWWIMQPLGMTNQEKRERQRRNEVSYVDEQQVDTSDEKIGKLSKCTNCGKGHDVSKCWVAHPHLQSKWLQEKRKYKKSAWNTKQGDSSGKSVSAISVKKNKFKRPEPKNKKESDSISMNWTSSNLTRSATSLAVP